MYNAYISLGNNCEAGLQFRRIQYENSSFFRFTYSPFKSTIELIKNDFKNVFLKENLVPLTDTLVRDTKYGISFHSRLPSQVDSQGKRQFLYSSDFDELYNQDYGKVLYLVNKWFRLVNSNTNTLYFIKDEKNTSRENAELLLNLFLKKYPDHNFSIVYLQLEQFREPDWGISRLFNRYFPKFAPRHNVPDTDIEAWNRLFFEFPLSRQATVNGQSTSKLPHIYDFLSV